MQEKIVAKLKKQRHLFETYKKDDSKMCLDSLIGNIACIMLNQVESLGMLPPLHDLDNFPGMKDNGWES